MNPTFRVEAFIVPAINRVDSSEDNNIIDDVKVAQKMTADSPKSFKCTEEDNINDEVINYLSEFNEINLNNSNDYVPMIKINPATPEESLYEKLTINIEEPIYDVPYSYLTRPREKIEPTNLRERFETAEYVSIQLNPQRKPLSLPHTKSLIKSSSLVSIDERGETPEDCTSGDLCCHGYKNGCTAITQRPEAVTEEIFEVNWMKRLEQLRRRESVIKDKEAMLFDRERLLFKKERELRILERLIKDKLKHAELYLKRTRSQNKDVNDCEVESKFSEQSKSSRDDAGSLESLYAMKKSGPNPENELITRVPEKINSNTLPRSVVTDEKFIKNPPNSRSSLMSAIDAQMNTLPSKSELGSSNYTIKSTVPGFSGYSSMRSRQRPKVTYDDLDSTLSADIGDSSFVVTSRKFDPEVFKRPYAFSRTMSERRPRTIHQQIPQPFMEEEKVLRRISDNIFVSKDKNTKYQDYGLIDNGKKKNTGRLISDDRRHSYLDLEEGKRTNKNINFAGKKLTNKERPISWNEESNEWLQKKRQAYNMQTAKKMSTEDFYNKENYESQWKVDTAPKKVSKGKKFNIFR